MQIRIDPAWLSAERYAEYLNAAHGDVDRASRLYEWNAAVGSALFELIAHFEVVLRNAIVRELDRAGQGGSMPPGTPWVQGAKHVDEVVTRLARRGQPPTAGRVYAGLTFGFWRNLFGTEYEELWRHSLKWVFRHSRADRQVIAEYLDSVNQLRNRIAHHGSLLDHDAKVEAQKLFRLAGWIDPSAEAWLRSIERVTSVAAACPVPTPRNTVVLPGANAWRLYSVLKQHAYLVPAGRSVRLTEYLAFYADQEVKQKVPRIEKWYDAVDWNTANARRLALAPDHHDRRLAKVISGSLANGWKSSVYQVFLLSGPEDGSTVTLDAPVAHTRTGRGSAFVKSHRYLTLGSLRSARDTRDLS